MVTFISQSIRREVLYSTYYGSSTTYDRGIGIVVSQADLYIAANEPPERPKSSASAL
jgi:hypothetical protein